MEERVQLSTLLDYVLQKSYGDLTQLAELLPRNSDEDKKLRIVQYARHTRQLLIQLLALVKWAQTSNPIRHCTDMFRELNHQSWVYVDTADQLAHLSRTTLQQAMMPILSLAPAIDVLTTGSYPRLPTCIKNRIIPRPPLTPEERAMTFILIEGVIRYRLAREHLPSAIMKVKSIGNGRVTLTVPYEFEVTLTLVGDDLSLPWRVLDLKILVGHALSGSPVLVTEQQRLYLLQLVQSRLCSVDGNLNDMFNTLHHFCLSLQLDCLHAEVERLSVAVCGVYMKVEDYVPGHLIRLVYWRHTGPAYLLNNTSSPWPRITIYINPHSQTRQLITSHTPPLSIDLSLVPNKLSFQDVLVQCIKYRSLSILERLKKLFNDTPWENKVWYVNQVS
uniref:Mediator of RNA polymerase II transcription subunit 14 n=3 Tax=Amphimedon queenslandica TaxID=400682 RepID=A0A1X7SWS4_AMPQE